MIKEAVRNGVMRVKISACIITFNEEANIRRCLESVKWCDEIVILDSFSTDKTQDICREYTDNIFQNEWMGYVGQRNLIREKATCEWVFYLDADEEVSSELQTEIFEQLESYSEKIVGYQFPRRVQYLGKWVLHGEWYPDIKLRLFKKDVGKSVGSEPHDYVIVDGAVKTLKYPINHYTYSGIEDHLKTVNNFTTIAADEKFKKNLRCSWFSIFFRSQWRFVRGYILKAGFLDGKRGLLIALISSFSVFIKYTKLWERHLLESEKTTGDE